MLIYNWNWNWKFQFYDKCHFCTTRLVLSIFTSLKIWPQIRNQNYRVFFSPVKSNVLIGQDYFTGLIVYMVVSSSWDLWISTWISQSQKYFMNISQLIIILEDWIFHEKHHEIENSLNDNLFWFSFLVLKITTSNFFHA